MRLLHNTPKPSNNSPIDPSSPVELIVFIALPILLIIAYMILRKRKRNQGD